jgi:hypothetical protein
LIKLKFPLQRLTYGKSGTYAVHYESSELTLRCHMPLKLIETKILANAVYMRLADDTDPQKADYWIEFQVPLDELKLAGIAGEEELGEIERRFVGSVRLAALRYARDLLGEETQALSSRIGR